MRAPPGGPNSFIFMQFSGTKLKNNSTFGSWRPPLGKILDPPLVSVNTTLKVINDLLLCNGMVALKGLSNTTRLDW